MNNYAKYGAAVYNIGYAEYINCSATNNVAYNSGAGFYDDNQGYSSFTNCTLNNSKYILNEGPGLVSNSVLTYIKNNLLASICAGSLVIGVGPLSNSWAIIVVWFRFCWRYSYYFMS